MIEREMDEQLKKIYAQWLEEIKIVAPEFLEDDKYSNPYFTFVPEGWCNSDIRILVVGEEGHGTWGRGKTEGVKPDDIQKIQEFCRYGLENYLTEISSPFWRRFTRLSEFGICAWTNLDTIHIRGDKCALSDKERIKLHSIDIKLLSEEMNVLKPTHVVFAGWYGLSLREELPQLYSELYPNGLADKSVWKNQVVYRQIGGLHYICAYHPNWGNMHKGYEDEVLRVFKETLK